MAGAAPRRRSSRSTWTSLVTPDSPTTRRDPLPGTGPGTYQFRILAGSWSVNKKVGPKPVRFVGGDRRFTYASQESGSVPGLLGMPQLAPRAPGPIAYDAG